MKFLIKTYLVSKESILFIFITEIKFYFGIVFNSQTVQLHKNNGYYKGINKYCTKEKS